jgi:DMSO/TMAO reductase YedYZ heme-binding membrane subunit
VSPQLAWYVSRSTGIVSWVLLSASALWGIALSTRLLASRPSPAWLLDLHRLLAGLACMLVAIHVGALVADNFVAFGPAEILVPLRSSWNPVAVAWGVVALYLLVAVELTSLLKRRMPARWWRRVHRSSFPLWLLATAHGLSAGPDTNNPVVQWSLLLIATIGLFVGIVRWLSPRPDRKARPDAGKEQATGNVPGAVSSGAGRRTRGSSRAHPLPTPRGTSCGHRS